MAGPEIIRALAASGDDLAILAMRANGQVPATLRKGKGRGADPTDPLVGAEKLLNGVDSVVGPATIGGIGLAMGVPAVGGALNWGGKQTGVSFLNRAGSGLTRLGQATFADVGRRVPLLGSAGRGMANIGMGALALGADALHTVGFTSMNASRWENKLSKQVDGVLAHAQTMFAAVPQHPPTVDAMGALRQSLGDFSPAHISRNMPSITEALKGAHQAAAAHGGDLAKHLRKFEKSLGNMTNAHAMHDNWKNLAEHTRAAPGRLGNVTVGHGMLNAGILAGVGVSDVRTGLSLAKSMRSLREMYADLTHQKPEDVSGMKLLFGKVPEAVAIARGQLFREYGPAVVLDGANTGVNLDFVLRGRAGFVNMALMMGLGMGSQMMRGALAGNLLPSYTAIKEAKERGEPAPPELYAALAGDASKELRARGGASSNFAKAMGEQYAALGASPAQVLEEAHNGMLHKRLEALRALAEQKKAEMAQSEEQRPSQVAKLSGTAPQEREVRGIHTQRMAQPLEKAHALPALP